MAKTLLKHMPPALALTGDQLGMSAFHHVAWGGSGKCLKVLTSHTSWREGLAQRDVWGRTPLIAAAAKVNGGRGSELQEFSEGRGL